MGELRRQSNKHTDAWRAPSGLVNRLIYYNYEIRPFRIGKYFANMRCIGEGISFESERMWVSRSCISARIEIEVISNFICAPNAHRQARKPKDLRKPYISEQGGSLAVGTNTAQCAATTSYLAHVPSFGKPSATSFEDKGWPLHSHTQSPITACDFENRRP
jgi:hypothetical protein